MGCQGFNPDQPLARQMASLLYYRVGPSRIFCTLASGVLIPLLNQGVPRALREEGKGQQLDQSRDPCERQQQGPACMGGSKTELGIDRLGLGCPPCVLMGLRQRTAENELLVLRLEMEWLL